MVAASSTNVEKNGIGVTNNSFQLLEDSYLFQPCWCRIFPLIAQVFGVRFDDSTKKVWFSLKKFDNILTHLPGEVLQIISWQCWYHFCVDFLRVQIFGDNLPKTALLHVQLTCTHLSSQPTIATRWLCYPLNVNFSTACWRPPAPTVIFHPPSPFLNVLCLSKDSVRDMVLFSYTY